jgi:two-component system LytT family response regulator
MVASRFQTLFSRPVAPPTVLTLWAGGTIVLWLLYAFVFTQTLGEPIAQALLDGAASVLPLALLAVAMHSLIKGQVMSRSVPVQTLLHAGLAIIFATTWYALVLVMLAFFDGVQGGGFEVAGFSAVAFTWQVFQGMILYAAIAATCYAVRGGRQAAEVAIVTAPPPLERYLTRAGEDMVPVSVRDIVTITGAQDYSEVQTLDGKRHLVRLSLGEFERRLDRAQFLRVHRSAIVNFGHVERLEPAGGGRLLAHMVTGEVVQTSRSGTQLLRQFVV